MQMHGFPSLTQLDKRLIIPLDFQWYMGQISNLVLVFFLNVKTDLQSLLTADCKYAKNLKMADRML